MTSRFGAFALGLLLLAGLPGRAEDASAADTGEAAAKAEATRETVGQRPEEPQERPEVTTLTEVGGVLTNRGTLRLEPSVEFVHTSIDRFNVRGFEIVQGAVLIGNIEAFSADRDTITQSITARYGVTNRFEVDLSIPVVYRDERFANTIPSQTNPGMQPTVITRSTRAYDLGDIEFGFHYQVNDGSDGVPFVVTNLRVKSDTGVGVFDVRRDIGGIEEELPTGSGFWGVGPSITLISPQDPAVLFANVGYLWNIERDVDAIITPTTTVGEVDPGDVISVSVGMGLAVNQDFSFNLGFGYSFITPTETEFISTAAVVRSSSSDLQAASVLFGFGYRFNQHLATSVDVSIGATEDAPDFRINLRVPISIPLPSPWSLFQ